MSNWDDGAVVEIARLRTALAAIEEIHQPTDEEVESWADDDDPEGHDRRFPDCEATAREDEKLCSGHTFTMKVCRECGHTMVDGEYPGYRPWPCPTLRAAGGAS